MHITKKHWEDLQETLLSQLLRATKAAEHIVYLDFPVHSNIGDLLIYAGTLKWFQMSKFKQAGHWHTGNFRYPKIGGNVSILLHGGGNFGDLYPQHQAFREKVIEAYPNNKIISLPQTLNFKQKNNLEKTSVVLSRHTELHLYWRDQESFNTAQKYFPHCHNYLAPDMATFLYPLQLERNSISQTDSKNFYLMRQDSERSAHNYTSHFEPPFWVGDWKKLIGSKWYGIRLFQLMSAPPFAFVSPSLFARLWEKLVDSVIADCASSIKGAKSVSTDRLHGHIFALLLEIESTAFDNNYGKIERYSAQWFQKSY